MLNCTIYAIIYNIILGFACFGSVWRFLLGEPTYLNRMKILRPCRSIKIAKKAQRRSIQSNRGQNHGLGRSRRSSKWIIVRVDLLEATMVRSWWGSWPVLAPIPPTSPVFLWLFGFQTFWCSAIRFFYDKGPVSCHHSFHSFQFWHLVMNRLHFLEYERASRRVRFARKRDRVCKSTDSSMRSGWAILSLLFSFLH